jgi:hypothetical protein
MKQLAISVFLLLPLLLNGCYSGGYQQLCYNLPPPIIDTSSQALQVGESLNISVRFVPPNNNSNCPGVRKVVLFAGKTLLREQNSLPLEFTWQIKAGQDGIPATGNIDMPLFAKVSFAVTEDTTVAGPVFVAVRSQ